MSIYSHVLLIIVGSITKTLFWNYRKVIIFIHVYFCTVNINRLRSSVASVKETVLQRDSPQKFSKIKQKEKIIEYDEV